MDFFYKDSLQHLVHSDFYSKGNSLEDKHIPVLFGDDQAYGDAEASFRFINKLIKLLNEHSEKFYNIKMEARYSTMDEFLVELKKNDLDYETYQGDFLP